MQSLFSNLCLVDVHRDVMRNIVSIRESQHLFDDLTDDPAQWNLAQQVEDDAKPRPYASATPIIHRPFEDAAWVNAIAWPFRNWQQSRFSDGTFGVWYGSRSIETTVYESAYHWYHRFLGDAGFQHEQVVGERKVYAVACNAALLDFRGLSARYPDVFHPTDYSGAQAAGARIHHEGHPGLLCPSVRHPQGENFVIMNPVVLSDPRFHCSLTYRVTESAILVEKQPGATWLEVEHAA